MAGGKAKKAPGQTWSGLDEDDLTGQAEAEEAQLIEFGRRAEAQPGETREPPEREKRCRKRKR
jgi:hypothetical protein